MSQTTTIIRLLEGKRRKEESVMTTNRLSPQEPSQGVIEFLKEEMTLRFALVKDRHPDVITTRVQDGRVFVEVWSTTGQWIMSSEDSVEDVIELGEMIKDQEIRAKMLTFFAEGVSRTTQHFCKRFLSLEKSEVTSSISE